MTQEKETVTTPFEEVADEVVDEVVAEPRRGTTSDGGAADATADPAERLPGLMRLLRMSSARSTPGGVPLLDLAGLAALVLAVAFFWGRAYQTWYWLDEGISVGIASHPLGDIPHLLRQDGAPPLYYLLLNVWMSAFGPSEASTHALSLIFAVATVPAALWAGWSLFGRRTGWICALLAAISPYLAFYATETRMYSMVTLLALLTVATFLHGFVFRRARYLPAFAVLLALLMYTHNWGVLFAVGLGVAVVPCFVLGSDRTRLAVRAVLAFGAAGLLYLPWLPTLLYQRSQDLQPWADKPVLLDIRLDVTQLVGGKEALVALGLGAAAGIVVLLRRPWGRHTVGVMVLAIVPFVVLFLGWRTGVVAYRYMAAVLSPLLLLLAVGIARGGRIAVAALSVAAVLTAPIGAKGPFYTKSNVRAVAEQVGSQVKPGDLVVLPDFEMVPLFSHYFPAGLRYATTSGLVPDEDIVDWRGSMDRLVDDDPARTLPPLVDSLPVGARVLLACPPVTSPAENSGLQGAPPADDSPVPQGSPQITALSRTVPPEKKGLFHAVIRLRCRETNRVLAGHPRLRMERTFIPPNEVRNTSVEGLLLTKT